jgi:hypothetical protein
MRLSAIVLVAISLTACSDVGIDDSGASQPSIPEGELCYPPEASSVRLRFQPARLVMAPGATREVRLIVEPDVCSPTELSFTSEDESVASPPAPHFIDYGAADATFTVEGLATGTTRIEVSFLTEGEEVTASLDVDVATVASASCSSDDDVSLSTLSAGASLSAGGSLAGARIELPENADAPNSGSFLWSVPAFDVAISCHDDMTPPGYIALGPAVRFSPPSVRWLRELPMSIPVHPARMPNRARMRHVAIMYSGPAARTPRAIPVADPRIEEQDGHWELSFNAPRLGSYQAVVPADAGTTLRHRRLSHRAVIGVSMGGAGAAQIGLRQHHLFDVVAPLGGPVDWTWMIDHIEHNHMAGFPAIAPGTKLEDIALSKTSCTNDDACAPGETCLGIIADPATPGGCTLLPQADEPYEHASTFNNWWYEYPRQGHGGNFPRDNYIQIFRDLALTFGNPNGHNPSALQLPAGVDTSHKSQLGDHAGDTCAIWLDAIDGHPDEEAQKQIQNSCPQERCKYPQVLKGYYDDEFNPDASFDVITVCDGSPRNKQLTPYANTWSPNGNNHPLEVALAVDYNGNGVRDEMEPIIRAGHENWSDVGEDGVASAQEPGYGPDNLDPAGDDYDAQYNPGGSEGDRRYQLGEPFEDTGLDGVAGTSGSPYDHGEGDGVFTKAAGLRYAHSYDARSHLRDWQDDDTTVLDEQELARLDLWTDGGTRDLFNFALTAQHLVGGFAARQRAVTYYTRFTTPPGLSPEEPNNYNPAYFIYEDMPGVVMQRYGKNEPTPQDIENGSGQHVGTANEIAKRLQSALFFIGSRWPSASRSLVEPSQDAPAEGAPDCQVTGTCFFDFTSSFGRTGPVAISFPPGYAHVKQQHVRYPVIFMLHGYGQTPEDLSATIVLLANWMNSPIASQATRLPKAILVYVDGRCRNGANGAAECLRGTFFADSARPDGPQMEKWWLELMDHIDQNYRTMGEAEIAWRN